MSKSFFYLLVMCLLLSACGNTNVDNQSIIKDGKLSNFVEEFRAFFHSTGRTGVEDKSVTLADIEALGFPTGEINDALAFQSMLYQCEIERVTSVEEIDECRLFLYADAIDKSDFRNNKKKKIRIMIFYRRNGSISDVIFDDMDELIKYGLE